MDYKISVENKSEVTRNINIEIPRQLYNQKYDQALSVAMRNVRLKGFRPGKAPKSMVAKIYGDRIHGDVLQELVSDAVRTAVSDHDLKIVGYPDINVEDENKDIDLKVVAEVDVYPEPTIANTSGLAIEVQTQSFDPSEVDSRLKKMQEERGTVEDITDRTEVMDGDVVKIDYSATIYGESFPGSADNDIYIEIGAKTSIDGIEEGIIGSSVGETKDVVVTMPKEAGPEREGKQANYTITVKGLFKKVVPELDDEFAKSTGMADDIAGLRSRLESNLKVEIDRKNKTEKEEQLFKQLVDKNPFEVPAKLVDQEIRQLLMEMRFLDPKKEESYQIDVTRFRDNLGPTAEQRVRKSIILTQLLEKDGVSAEESEVDTWLDGIAEEQGQSRDQINRIYGFPKNLSRLKEIVASEKLIDSLLANTTVTEKIAAEK